MTCVAIGKFDALHRGHRALIEAAAQHNTAVSLLTFSGMAAVLQWPERPSLVALADRQRITDVWAQALRISLGWIELPFAEVRPLEPAAFVALLKNRLGAQAVVVGADYRFGRNRSGNSDDLLRLGREADLHVTIVPAVEQAGLPISSSRIRQQLEVGDVHAAAELLGRPHRVIGTVVRGDGRGRSLGFPTANCSALENMAPGPGVYACWAEVNNKRFPAAVNIGVLPTIGAGRALTVEAHLIGFSGECYQQRLALDFIAYLRGEQRFASVDELKIQIARDVAETPGRLGL